MTDRGFTLIEALVAMAVLAVGAISLLGAVEAHSGRIGDIENRLAARWVAENRLTELRLGLEVPEDVRLLGRDWRVGTDRIATTDPDLARVDIRVTAADGPGAGAVLAVLTGFIPAEGGE